MSQPLATGLFHAFHRIVKMSSGQEEKVSEDNGRLELEASFCNGKYHLSITLAGVGYRYEVVRFVSVEAVIHLYMARYLPAEYVLNYVVKRNERWNIPAPVNFVALFRAHNELSLFEGMKPIFILEEKTTP